MKCLLIASIFPPINGGSAVVYDSLCRFAPSGTMHVLAPWRHYYTGEVIEGWQAFDAAAPFSVHRMELLRPCMVEPKSRLHSLWLVATVDIPLKLRVLWTTYRLIRREGIKVICIGELNSGSWLGVFCQTFLGCKLINYIHGEEIVTVSPYRYYGRHRKKYLHRADAVVAVSNFTGHALIDHMGVAPEKIELIMNGVDTDRFQPGPRDQALVQRYGLEDRQILVTVGRLVERKGIDATLKALPTILKACPKAHYLIIGEGEYRPELERLVRELKLEDHVTFCGKVASDELVAHYQLCDLFLMPNRELSNQDTEGFGLVFLEANACKKAVIGGRAGGAVEAVQNGKNGLLVDGSDIEELAAKVIQLLTDTSLRRQIEEKGLEIARNSSSRIRALQFYRLCRRLAGEDPLP